MEKFCSNCGRKLNENADVCLNCGKIIKKNNNMINNNLPKNNSVLYKKPGKGFSITGMILGIYNVYGSVLNLITINSNIDSLSNISIFKETVLSTYIFIQIVFRIMLPVLGLVFSIIGYKKQQNNFNKSGLILNTIALALSIIILVYTFLSIS